MAFNIDTGEFDEDEHPLGGDIGEQAASPVRPMPPSPLQAPGPELMSPQPGTLSPAPVAQVPATPQFPQVAPYVPAVPSPIPVSRVVKPAEAANLAAIDQSTAARNLTAQQQGGINVTAKAEQVKAADAQAEEADRFLKDRQKIQDDATKRIAERTASANADYEAYKKFGIKDPDAEASFGTRILKAIVVGFGQYAANVNGGPNAALQIITDANRDNIARQKAQQEKLFQTAQRSGKNVEEAQRARDDAFKQLDLKHSALLESSAALLRSEMAKLGVPQAQIEANKEIQKIEQDALGIRERTLAGIRDDETNLARADIAAAGRVKKATGTGGGGAKLEGSAQLAEYAQKNPGDTAGLYRLGAKLGLGQKEVNAAITQNKAPDSAQGVAVKAASAIRAIDRIESMKYTPSRDEIQKWLNNQRQVALAEEAGKKGGVLGLIGSAVAGGLQNTGAIAQNEYDGLSPRARMYFTNVRQYMENIGREASGAAISQGEWNNFYGQYGPQSEGGLAAARQNVRDRFKLTGVAGRQLEQSGSVPDAAPVKAKGAAGQADEATRQAQQIIDDPKMAERAAKQYGMTVQQVRARAVQELRKKLKPMEADIVL